MIVCVRSGCREDQLASSRHMGPGEAYGVVVMVPTGDKQPATRRGAVARKRIGKDNLKLTAEETSSGWLTLCPRRTEAGPTAGPEHGIAK